MRYHELIESPDDRLTRAAEQGFELPLFHKTSAEFDSFAPNSHFGTEAQATMRGRKDGRLIAVLVRGTRFKRLKDIGRNKWDAAALRRLERQGYDGVVYLNRYEGIPYEQFEILHAKVDDDTKISDTAFKKLVPAAEDSYIIFDPKNIRSVDAAFDPEKKFKLGLMN